LIVTIKDGDGQEKNNLEYGYEVTQVSAKQLIIKVDFDNPE
jgi:hypothetical protein